MEYTDPRDWNVKLQTNGNDAMIEVSGQVTGMVDTEVVPASMAYVATRGFDALMGSGTTTTTPDRNNVSIDRHDITDSHDQTATTTVVSQPAPTVISSHEFSERKRKGPQRCGPCFIWLPDLDSNQGHTD